MEVRRPVRLTLAAFRCPGNGTGQFAQPVRDGAKANGGKALRGRHDWLSNGATCAGPRSRDGGTRWGRERQRLSPGDEHSSCLKCCEMRRYRVGRCVSHLSPPSASPSLTAPVTGAIGRGNGCCRRCSAAVVPLSQQTVARGKKSSSGIKGTNYILPLTFGLMSEWGSVVISALSPQPPCFLCQGRRVARPATDVTLAAWTAPEGWLIPLSAAAPLISHTVHRLHSGLHVYPPGAGRDLPAKACASTQTPSSREARTEGSPRPAKTKIQTNLSNDPT